jgi:hypothetical protein
VAGEARAEVRDDRVARRETARPGAIVVQVRVAQGDLRPFFAA